jgi:hypothetical protein
LAEPEPARQPFRGRGWTIGPVCCTAPWSHSVNSPVHEARPQPVKLGEVGANAVPAAAIAGVNPATPAAPSATAV